MPADGLGFEQRKYLVTHSLVAEPLPTSLYRYALKRPPTKPTEWEKANEASDAPLTASVYADPMMDMLLANLTPQVGQPAALQLYPTFSYYRVYQRGDLLEKHRDRPVRNRADSERGADADQPWPLWIESPAGVVSVCLQPGDAILYRGLECPHWREPFQGVHAVQIFLFYVDQKGPHAEWKFDKRERLSSFQSLASQVRPTLGRSQ